MRSKLLLLVLSGLFITSAPVAYAEEVQKVRVLDAKLIEYTPGSEVEQKIRVARKLIQKKSYEAASALLETLYEQDRGSPVVVNLLFICYDRLG
jgi:uncharacterized protein HemY